MSMDRYGENKGTLPLYNSGPSRPKPRTAGLSFASQFEISGYMIAASFVFWICMGIAAIYGFQYGMIYWSFDDEKLEEPNCCTSFGGTFADRQSVVESWQKGEAGPYLMRLGPEMFNGQFKGTVSPAELTGIPPMVTAVTSADFYDVQTLIQQWTEKIKPAQPTMKFIIYSLGLYSKELDLITRHCDCEVRTFQTGPYPNHVADFSTFAYRPIIIQNIIEEFGSVFWINPNYLITRASDLNQLKYRGDRDFYLWQPEAITGTIAYTNPRTFEYLQESRCCYLDSSLVDMSAVVFYRTNTSWSSIMKPWLKCALNKDCIAPKSSRYEGCFHMRSPKTTGCHRYDQSVLSIILDRVYSFSMKPETYIVPRVTRRQETYVEYFPEQPWTFTEIFFVTLMPLACIGGLFFLYWRRKNIAKSNYRKR